MAELAGFAVGFARAHLPGILVGFTRSLMLTMPPKNQVPKLSLTLTYMRSIYLTIKSILPADSLIFRFLNV